MGIRDLLIKKDIEVIAPASIITDREVLELSSEKATFAEASKIWKTLKVSLDTSKGWGISAIQIGIKKAVSYINFDGKEYELLNTKIIKGNNPIIVHNEGCLSFPGKRCNTTRFANITILDDNLGEVSFSEKDGLLPIIIQHEVDHMNGQVMFNKVRQPIKSQKRVGRNDICPCKSGKKYKKCCGSV